MRIVVSSDYHLDHTTRGISRFEEIRAAVNETVTFAISRKAGAWVFLGDAMDPDSGSGVFRCLDVLVGAVQTLAKADIPSILVAGNHDVIESAGYGTTLSPLRSINPDMVFVFDEPGTIEMDGVRFIALPFTSTDRPYNPTEYCKSVKIDAGDIVLSHLTVPGIIPGEETHELPRGSDILYPLEETARASWRLQGHYHRQQAFDPRDGGPPILIPGSLARLTFGEEANRPTFLCFDTRK